MAEQQSVAEQKNIIIKNKSLVGLGKVLLYVFLIALVIVCIIPFYLMIINATRTNIEITRGPTFLPGSNLLENLNAFSYSFSSVNSEKLNVVLGLWNSFLVSTAATLLAGYCSALTAYGFSIYRFRGRKLLFGLLLSVIMLPPTITLIGTFKLMLSLQLFNTRWALILPAIASPYTVFFLRGYIGSAVNKHMIEAARIDGAGELRIFHRIAFPLIMPGVATMSIFGFLAQWNSYILPLTLLQDQSKYTLPLIIQQLNVSNYNRDLGALYTGVAISVVPILIAFAIFSRYLVAGISFGAVKE